MADRVVLEESKATNEKYEVVHQKPETFYHEYERKADLKHQTHYCPGCGHGVVHKLIAEALQRSWAAGPRHSCEPGRLLCLRLLLL